MSAPAYTKTYLFNSNSRIQNSRNLILCILLVHRVREQFKLIEDYDYLSRLLSERSTLYSEKFASRREARSEFTFSASLSGKSKLLNEKFVEITSLLPDGTIVNRNEVKDPLIVENWIFITEKGIEYIEEDFWLEVGISDIFRECFIHYLELTLKRLEIFQNSLTHVKNYLEELKRIE